MDPVAKMQRENNQRLRDIIARVDKTLAANKRFNEERAILASAAPMIPPAGNLN